MQDPTMSPAPGECLLRFLGDRVTFALGPGGAGGLPAGWQAYLRTNLGRARRVRDEIIESYAKRLPSAGASWRDLPMEAVRDEWKITLPLVEVGYFQAKAYLVDEKGRQVWPAGPNVGVTVHPDPYRTANTIYCAFVRMFGETKSLLATTDEKQESQFVRLDKRGYTVIPPSGKLRNLIQELPHIMETLGCRILHLLPINPTPTTFARFGRFGSPYASQDLLAVDPALVEFDRRTTGIDQFRELTYAVHQRGGKVFLDIVTNHTGWGSPLQENHPEWFLRQGDGRFASPGAWGVTWEDLVELDHRNPASWEYLAEVFLTWCRRGVDGFRCDAGYKVPMAAWRYITACVREEFPDTVFLLEGLGGSWEATELLLKEGGMQWAYSELFQNYSGTEVASYLEYVQRQSERVGLYVHYSETHDNPRLADKGALWSLLRNRLCGLTSVAGSFGFTCGVEWLATEKVQVHSSRGMNWGGRPNLMAELSALNQLLSDHPCFFDGARLARLSTADSIVYALHRESEEGLDHVLVLVNTDWKAPQRFVLPSGARKKLGALPFELLGQAPPEAQGTAAGDLDFTLPAGASYCLAPTARPNGLAGDAYRRARACAAFGLQALSCVLPVESIGPFSWRSLAERVDADPKAFLASLKDVDPTLAQRDLLSALDQALRPDSFSQVVTWDLADLRRITLVPSGNWLLVGDGVPFRATLSALEPGPRHVQSIAGKAGFVAFFPPRHSGGDATLLVERYGSDPAHLEAQIRFLGTAPDLSGLQIMEPNTESMIEEPPLVLLSNGRGGMARLSTDLGRIRSKYDCLLGANLHPTVPVDRHIFAKRFRTWVIADRFLSPLDQYNLARFDPGPPARWQFLANAGDGRKVQVDLIIDMLDNRNTVALRFKRTPRNSSDDLPLDCPVRLTVRIDLEDRNFHWETRRNGGADYHFSTQCRPLEDQVGFEFTPAADRILRAVADKGQYHHEAEWSENIPHPIEQSRGQTDRGDAYSPGWFDLPLENGSPCTLVLSAEKEEPDLEEIGQFEQRRASDNEARIALARLPENDAFGRRLVLATHQFVVRRGAGKTIIAGYPWFLDWGRDTFICARGLLSAGLVEDVTKILLTFGRFEKEGTLPNSIFGEDASNRDTSDAPLWYGLACEETASLGPPDLYDLAVEKGGRTLRGVLISIAEGYLRGTPNGIRVDPASGLVWSPSHFTWMDTNFPAGTPREGYPIEIQVLWIRLLRHVGRIDSQQQRKWAGLASLACDSFLRLYWMEAQGYFADCLLARAGQDAASAILDTALRSNYLFAISLGLVSGQQARRGIAMAQKYLIVPGALRTLAPLPVSPALPVYGNDGRLLNNPQEPYFGRYEGDEDTRRKPAYHNGTAWTWTFASFCEALALAWECQPSAVAAAQGYLSSLDQLLTHGCLGQLPEIVDGDAPHQQRGCDAQAWGVTEALRVWKWLQKLPNSSTAA
jgi:starch synthase (maltosyl-transferring)